MNRRICALVVGFLAAQTAIAGTTETARDNWQDTNDITAAAEHYVYQNANNTDGKLIATAGFLDPRLMLARCTQSLEAFLRPGTQLSGRIVVGVRCSGEKPWKVYLPVNVGVMKELIVTSRSLSRDHIVGPDDITTEYRDVSRLVGDYIRTANAVVDRRIVRPVSRGVVLRPSNLQDQTLIKRGQSVTISVISQSINIQMAGIAESDGSADQLIAVRNLDSGRIVEGRVRARGLVEVAMH